MHFNDMTKAQQKQAVEGSGYDREQLKEENPYFVEDYNFKEYAQELAEDIGAIPETNEWPLYCIDWEWAARELEMDYSSVDIDGITYLFRAW